MTPFFSPLALLICLVASLAQAQTYPSPTFTKVKISGCSGGYLKHDATTCVTQIPAADLAPGAAVANIGYTPGTVSSVGSGFGLTGGPVNGAGSIAYDPTQIGWSTRNRLLNSGMAVDQVNVGAAYTLTTISGVTNYTLDGWVAYESAAGAGLTAQRQSIKSGGVNYALRIQRANGSTNTNTTTLAQVLETDSNIDLQGKAVTLSFRARKGANFSAASSQITADIVTGTGTDQTSASYAAGTWTGQATCGTATPTLTSSFAFYVVTCTIPAGATQIGVDFDIVWTGTAGAADYIDITDIELVPGTYTAAQIVPEHPSLRKQIADCQRYFIKSYAMAVPVGTPLGLGMGTGYYIVVNANSATTGVTFPVRMRATPTLTTYDQTGAAGKSSCYSSGWDSGCVPTIAGPTDSFFIVGGNNYGWTGDYTANARL